MNISFFAVPFLKNVVPKVSVLEQTFLSFVLTYVTIGNSCWILVPHLQPFICFSSKTVNVRAGIVSYSFLQIGQCWTQLTPS